MVRALLTLGLGLGLWGCPLYNPSIPDCAVRCSSDGKCPTNSACHDGFCRPDGAQGQCECRVGDERACGGGLGDCTPGVQRCGTDGTWGTTCVGEVTPRQEVCDNRDNDCDGVVDNNAIDTGTCPLTLGVCAASHPVCTAGVPQACDAKSYGAKYEPSEVACDGLDNDCDGEADLSRAATLATDVLSNRPWDFLGYDGGFALVYQRRATTNDAGMELVVRRFDPALQAAGSPVVLETGAKLDHAVRNLGPDLYVGVRANTLLRAMRVGADNMVTDFEDGGVLLDVDWLKAGVSDELVFAGYAPGYHQWRVAKWHLDGGFMESADLDALERGFDSNVYYYSFNLSDRGHWLLIGGQPGDGGYFQRDLVETNGYKKVVDVAYYGGSTADVVETATKVTSTYWYYDTEPGYEISGIYHLPDLVAQTPEIAVQESGNPNAWGEVSTAADNQGNLIMAVRDNLHSKMVLDHSDATGIAFTERVLPQGVAFGSPRVATAGSSPSLGLAWAEGAKLSAVRVCW